MDKKVSASSKKAMRQSPTSRNERRKAIARKKGKKETRRAADQ